MKKKTIDDLIQFCENQKFTKFSSKDTGFQLSIQVPATFEEEKEVDNAHRGMMRVKVKIFHTGLNKNQSYVSEEAAKKAMPSIKNRPLLAAIHQLDDGSWDFESHNYEIVTNDDGEEEIHYIEQQIGSFSEEEPFFEYDEENDKNFVCAYGWIPEEYTKAADILREKDGTKNSVELCIDEFSYNAKEKYLDLSSFYVEASTFLGKRDDGTEIGEGMQGSRADIEDFSIKENHTAFSRDEKLIEVLDKLNETLSDFNINKNAKEGGTNKNMDKFNELLSKYEKTVEDIDFEYEGLTDEELEAKFNEVFGEEKPEDDPEVNPSAEGEDPEEGQTSVAYSYTVNGETRSFAVSLQDKIYAIQDLVNATYAEADNTYYGVTVFENYVVMCDYWNGRYYKQNYTSEKDVYTLTGDRVEVYTEFVTAEEQTELDNMRSNYSSISEELEKYQKAEENEKKDQLFESDDYKNIADTEQFAELQKDHSELSFEELESKLDEMLLSYAKSGSLTFSVKEEKTKPTRKSLIDPKKNQKRDIYGGLFSKK